MQEKVAKEQGRFYLFFSLSFLFLPYLSFYFHAALLSQNHRIIRLKKISRILKLLQRCFVFLKRMKQIHMASFLMPLSSSPAPDKMTFSISLQALQRESNTPWESFGSAADTFHAEHGLGK